MTLEEAQKVADVLITADGGCSNCAFGLASRMEEAFPEFTWNFSVDEEEYELKIDVRPLASDSSSSTTV